MKLLHLTGLASKYSYFCAPAICSDGFIIVVQVTNFQKVPFDYHFIKNCKEILHDSIVVKFVEKWSTKVTFIRSSTCNRKI